MRRYPLNTITNALIVLLFPAIGILVAILFCLAGS